MTDGTVNGVYGTKFCDNCEKEYAKSDLRILVLDALWPGRPFSRPYPFLLCAPCVAELTPAPPETTK